MTNPYDDLPKNQANYAPLTPLTFIERAAYVYPDRAGRRAWRCSAGPGNRPTPGAGGWHRRWPGGASARTIPCRSWRRIRRRWYEAAFGVPMCGAVLNTLNTRLDAETIAFMLRHGGAKVLITDREFSPVIEAALALLDDKPLVIDLDDPAHAARRASGRN